VAHAARAGSTLANPAAQRAHDVPAAAGWNVPSAHALQAAARVALLAVPAGQAAQTRCPGRACAQPRPQSSHAEASVRRGASLGRVELALVPTGHFSQSGLPADPWKRPTPQAPHCDTPVFPAVELPAAHAWHWPAALVKLVPLPKRPAAHALQPSWACAGWNCPRAHALQLVCPAAGWNAPAVQFT
jgi:hypothetical protein